MLVSKEVEKENKWKASTVDLRGILIVFLGDYSLRAFPRGTLMLMAFLNLNHWYIDITSNKGHRAQIFYVEIHVYIEQDHDVLAS